MTRTCGSRRQNRVETCGAVGASTSRKCATVLLKWRCAGVVLPWLEPSGCADLGSGRTPSGRRVNNGDIRIARPFPGSGNVIGVCMNAVCSVLYVEASDVGVRLFGRLNRGRPRAGRSNEGPRGWRNCSVLLSIYALKKYAHIHLRLPTASHTTIEVAAVKWQSLCLSSYQALLEVCVRRNSLFIEDDAVTVDG